MHEKRRIATSVSVRRMVVRPLVLVSCSVATIAAIAACGEFESNNETPPADDAGDASESDAITGKVASFSITTTNVAVIDGESADVVVKIAREGILGDTCLELIDLPEGLTSK